MKVRIFIITVVSLLVLSAFLPRLLTRHKGLYTDKNNTVYIEKTSSGFQLIRNGCPFYIKGVAGKMHFDDLELKGGNTIRLYDTLQIAEYLDEAYRNNLAVIIDIVIPPYNKSYNYYSSEDKNQVLRQKIKALVNRYKNHPALLMWNLGNEIQYPVVVKKNDYIKFFNNLIDLIKEEDSNHPVSTAMSGIPIRRIASIFIHSPNLDLTAYNSFGSISELNDRIRKVNLIFGRRPFYISEFGANGPWESEKTAWNAPVEPTSSKKLEQIRQRYYIIKENKSGGCLGSFVFYWGTKWETTPTWFSFYHENHKSKLINLLEVLWKDSIPSNDIITIKNLTFKGNANYKNLIFEPNEHKITQVEFENPGKNIRITWEIHEEAWALKWLQDSNNNFDQKVIDNFISFEGNSASFLTPEKEGAYRIFIFAYDENEYFDSANVPFYVLARK